MYDPAAWGEPCSLPGGAGYVAPRSYNKMACKGSGKAAEQGQNHFVTAAHCSSRKHAPITSCR